ncbi:MAG: hypothetical protein HY852_12145 [Bradyrhizobium sp.]|uniref:hypothetical protein n=1 Tax=Bradyrhizobium sp. TaxID=376 RepID=UPI0025C309DE|nr:hypothetical protein [Bradyrhizobium sp.]MBI5262554.1 hypothetical protein [Bradyrhizobium sp.]
MTDEEAYAELPDDPEMAFLQLEKHFREQCEAKLKVAGENDYVNMYYVEYISKVVAAIQELGISTEFETEVPSIANVSYQTYADFGKDVDHYRTKLSIRHARRAKGYSVRFDAATKTKIRHHLEQMRQIIEKLEVNRDKKQSLLDKLNDFAKEVDRDRTRFEAWGAVVIQAAEVFGEAAERAEPARKWLDSIGRLIWGAKENETETKHLPPPKEVKKIGKRSDLDDDIPF